MKTLREIHDAAKVAATASLEIGETNFELNSSCIEAFKAAGGSDPEDFEIFERYWRSHRQTLKTTDLHVKQLGDRPSPSAAKTAAAEAKAKAATISSAGKIAALIAMLLSLCLSTPVASAQMLAGSGINIAPLSTSNLTSIVQVGTFYLNPTPIILNNSGGITNPTLCPHYMRLTFDGSNYFTLPQWFTNNAGSNWSNQTLTWTNLSLSVYCSLTISNGQNQAISNLTAIH